MDKILMSKIWDIFLLGYFAEQNFDLIILVLFGSANLRSRIFGWEIFPSQIFILLISNFI
jgi:hypothetical protein